MCLSSLFPVQRDHPPPAGRSRCSGFGMVSGLLPTARLVCSLSQVLSQALMVGGKAAKTSVRCHMTWRGDLPSPPPSPRLRYVWGLSKVLFYSAVAFLQYHIPWTNLQPVAIVCKCRLASAVQIPRQLVVYSTKSKLALHNTPKLRQVLPGWRSVVLCA